MRLALLIVPIPLIGRKRESQTGKLNGVVNERSKRCSGNPLVFQRVNNRLLSRRGEQQRGWFLRTSSLANTIWRLGVSPIHAAKALPLENASS
jgi:hypothetical protein